MRPKKMYRLSPFIVLVLGGSVAIYLVFVDYTRNRATLRLAQAVQNCNATEVQKWLAKGADPNGPNTAPSETVWDLFLQACHINQSKKFGRTILIRAAGHCDEPILSKLLDAGGDVRYGSSTSGETALIYAVLSRKHANVRLLINRGSDVNCQALYYTPLIAAGGDIRGPDPEDIALLLAHGADPNRRFRYGETPLMRAAAYSNRAGVTYLLKAGANVNARDDSGNTPLMFAAVADRPKVIQLLLQSDADPRLRNSEGKTAEDLAHDDGNKDLVKVIREFRASPHTDPRLSSEHLLP